MKFPLHKRHLGACVLTAFVGFGFAQHSYASDLDTSPYLFGDWNGERTRLADEGVTFDLGYGSEAAHNFSGGDAHLTRYTDQWKLGAKFDLAKLWGWQGATFQMVVTDRNGRDLGADADIGNNQLIQEVYGRGQTWHLTIFALDQKFFDGKLDWRIGRLPVGDDFASFSCDFQNLTFCGAPAGNIAGNYWINWPTSVWATRVKYQTSANTYVQVGAYQVNPNYTDQNYEESEGLLPDFPGGTKGALMPFEFGYTPSINGLPGSYKFGGWYNNAGGSDLYLDINHQPMALTDAAPLQRSSQYGGYINFQQQLTGDAGGKGVTVFFNATQADHSTSATDRQFATGMEYKGIFDRPNDMVGFAVGATHASSLQGADQRLYNELHPTTPVLVEDSYEYVTELFYSWSPIPSISFRPNLQYIVHPGGSTQNSNAFVVGLKSAFTF